jgi:hypothetical protein
MAEDVALRRAAHLADRTPVGASPWKTTPRPGSKAGIHGGLAWDRQRLVNTTSQVGEVLRAKMLVYPKRVFILAACIAKGRMMLDYLRPKVGLSPFDLFAEGRCILDNERIHPFNRFIQEHAKF